MLPMMDAKTIDRHHQSNRDRQNLPTTHGK